MTQKKLDLTGVTPADERVYADYSGEVEQMLHQKTLGIGFGRADLVQILQTLSGLWEDGEILPTSKDDEGRYVFVVSSDVLQQVVNAINRLKARHASARGFDNSMAGMLADLDLDFGTG